MPLPQPSWPAEVQTVTQPPSASRAIAGWVWLSGV
jgi:hypothetical protein